MRKVVFVVNWRGTSFKFVRVKTNGREKVMPIGEVLYYAYKSRLRGEMTIWSQPKDKDGNLINAFRGDMVFRFLGDGGGYWDLPKLPAVIELINRVNASGVGLSNIRVGLAKRDLYVFVSPGVLKLSPDERFPRLCAGIAMDVARGLPYDPSIYDSHAFIPIPNSRLDDGTYFTLFYPSTILNDEIEFAAISLISGSKHRKSSTFGPAGLPDNDPQSENELLRYGPLKIDATKLDPISNPDNPGILEKLPSQITLVLPNRVEDSKLEQLCFGIGLAVKSLGASVDDAMAIIDTAVDIDRMNRNERHAAVERAFSSNLQYGARKFAKIFHEHVPEIPEEKSPIIRIRREWLKTLLSAKAPYQAHCVMYKLLLDFHSYPRPWLPIPTEWPEKSLRKGLQSLEEHGIIRINKGKRPREIHLINVADLDNNYVQVDVAYVEMAIQSDEAVKMFSALLASSLHKKGQHKTNAKFETLAKNIGVSVRTGRSYLKELRKLGIEISTDLRFSVKYCTQELPVMP